MDLIYQSFNKGVFVNVFIGQIEVKIPASFTNILLTLILFVLMLHVDKNANPSMFTASHKSPEKAKLTAS